MKNVFLFFYCNIFLSFYINTYCVQKYCVCIWPSTYLLTNPSRLDLRSSMKLSSQIPSSDLKGSWRFKALLGRGGTTIWKRKTSEKIETTQTTYKQKTLKHVILLRQNRASCFLFNQQSLCILQGTFHVQELNLNRHGFKKTYYFQQTQIG